MKIKYFILGVLSGSASFSPVVAQGMANDGGICNIFQRMSVDPVSMEVIASEKISLNFSVNLGEVNIIIQNNSGLVVYQRRVDTAQHSFLDINISNFATGSYTLRCTDNRKNISKEERFIIH